MLHACSWLPCPDPGVVCCCLVAGSNAGPRGSLAKSLSLGLCCTLTITCRELVTVAMVALALMVTVLHRRV